MWPSHARLIAWLGGLYGSVSAYVQGKPGPAQPRCLGAQSHRALEVG